MTDNNTNNTNISNAHYLWITGSDMTREQLALIGKTPEDLKREWEVWHPGEPCPKVLD